MSTAVITPTYANDFERCKLQCETLDARLKGSWTQYLLVADHDVELFKQLETKNRKVVGEREIFPWWIRSFPDFVSSKHKWVWLSPFSKPLRGWHTQQLRILSMTEHLEEEVMVTIDSDVVLLKDFDVADLAPEGKVRLYKKADELEDSMDEHLRWTAHAGKLLGINDTTPCRDDYVNTFIAWRVPTVRKLLRHIEKVHGRHWMKSMIRNRNISEAMIYGRFVSEIENLEHHTPNSLSLCHVMWSEHQGDVSIKGLKKFISELTEGQVAAGIQSFVNADVNDIRKVISHQ